MLKIEQELMQELTKVLPSLYFVRGGGNFRCGKFRCGKN